MKNNLRILSLFIFSLATLSSCTTDEIQPTETVHSVHISNGGKPFEYWLEKEYYGSNGDAAFLYVPKGTQITIGATVEVIEDIEIIPNIQVYQDDKAVELRQITKGFFLYRVK